MKKTIQQLAILLLATALTCSCKNEDAPYPYEREAFVINLEMLTPEGTNIVDSLWNLGYENAQELFDVSVNAATEQDKNDIQEISLRDLNAQGTGGKGLYIYWIAMSFYNHEAQDIALNLRSQKVFKDESTHRIVFSLKQSAESRSYDVQAITFDGQELAKSALKTISTAMDRRPLTGAILTLTIE